jgi:hypothetical protein
MIMMIVIDVWFKFDFLNRIVIFWYDGKQDIVRNQREPSQEGASTDRRHDRSQKNLKLFLCSHRLDRPGIQFARL